MSRSSRKFSGRKISRLMEEPPPPSSSLMLEINLPTDILIEILKRLPLKSLIRSTCVCKSWSSLLTSPTFLSTLATFNFRYSNDIQKFYLFKEAINVHLESSRTNLMVFRTVPLSKKLEFVCPVGKKHFIVCAVDGLVCLFDFYSRNPSTTPLILLNPSLCKAIQVPVPSAELDFTLGGFPKLIFGCGFDSFSNDYKVVRIGYFNGREGNFKRTDFRVDVYSVWGGEWRNNGVSYFAQNIITIRWRGVYFNGVIHWVCNVIINDDGCDSIHRLILTFKLRNEEFGELKLPKDLVDVTNQSLRVVVVPRGGREVLGAIHNIANVFNLWVMDDHGGNESWVKLFSINFGSMIKNDMNVAVLNDHFVLVQTLLRGWVSYNHKTEQIQDLVTIPGGVDYVDAYVESLILLGQRKGVLKCKDLQGPTRKGLRRLDWKNGSGRGKSSRGMGRAL